ncbi:hypothetical protein MMC22_008462 [Lobaria immixta]|nr:hypothetical protein [Lobaria immixta]
MLWRLVNGTAPFLDPETRPIDNLAWKFDDPQAKAWIYGRLNFLKRKFFNYGAGAAESIDDISSELSRLQIIIRDIKETKASTDLDVALTLINSVDNEAYMMAKHHLEDMRELILAHTKERLKLVEQKIRDEMTPKEDTANKAFTKGKDKRTCFFC